MDDADRIVDTALLVRAQAGDRGAFRDLVARFDSPLRYFARRLVDDPAAADDIVQDVWLAAIRQLSGVRSGAAFRVWLFQVTRNRAISHQRKRAVRATESIDPAEIPNDAELDDFPAEVADRIHEGLAALSVEHREALTLRFLEDMSYDEIAAGLEPPVEVKHETRSGMEFHPIRSAFMAALTLAPIAILGGLFSSAWLMLTRRGASRANLQLTLAALSSEIRELARKQSGAEK